MPEKAIHLTKEREAYGRTARMGNGRVSVAYTKRDNTPGMVASGYDTLATMIRDTLAD